MAQGQHGWYTPEYKMEVVQKYLSDNYKVEPFCREIGISKSTFYCIFRIIPARHLGNCRPLPKGR